MHQLPKAFDPLKALPHLWSPHDFPDLRLFKRLSTVFLQLLTRLSGVPQSFHRAIRRATLRLLNNCRWKGPPLLQKACAPLLASLLSFPEIICAHDSSEIQEQGRDCPEDAGPLRSSLSRGYLIHVSSVCTPTGSFLGALDGWAWTRSWDLHHQ